MKEPNTYVGPFDREAWPEQLIATVVSPGDAAPRLAGYDVGEDLARHYGVADVAWLALRGELPSDDERAAFEAALVLLSPVHIGEAPAHAAYLSHLLAAQPSATIAVAAVGLGELGRTEHAELAEWLTWLDEQAKATADPVREPDTATLVREPDNLSALPTCALTPAAPAPLHAWLDAAMRRWFGPARGLPAAPLSRLACAYALLHRLGFRDALTLQLLATWARLPTVLAEARAAQPGAVRTYPARLPDYRYVDDEGSSP